MDLTKNKIDATLIYLVRGEGGKQKVLLAQKTKKINVGRFCGFGGSIEERETPRACAVRELKQETGFFTFKKNLEFAGVITFHNKRENGGKFDVRVFVFVLKEWRGKLKLKKDEVINPRWFKIYRLPFKKMPPGDRTFLPEILNGSRNGQIVRGQIWYSKNQEKLLGQEIKWVGKTSDVD